LAVIAIGLDVRLYQPSLGDLSPFQDKPSCRRPSAP